jgi:hypothetical protein
MGLARVPAPRRRPQPATPAVHYDAAVRARVLAIATAGLILALSGSAQAAKLVSYPALLSQIQSGPLIRAVINRTGGDIEIKFRDLSEWKAYYPPGAQPRLQALLHRRHIEVIFATRSHAKPKAATPVHHHLRYIAAAILAAAALAGVAWLLFRRLRARREPRGDPAPG